MNLICLFCPSCSETFTSSEFLGCSCLVLMPRSAPPVSGPGPLVELLSVGAQLGAWLLALSCCLSPWMELQSELVELERVQVGLWSGCVVQDSVFSCKSHSSLLNLPPPLLLGRGLLLGALLSGGAAVAVTVPGLSLVRGPQSEDLKRRLRVGGVALCLVAAALEAGPVSLAGHVTVARFREDAVLEMAPRWDLGVGLFLGWTSAAVYVLAAGALWSTLRRGGAGGQRGGAEEQTGGTEGQRGGARQEYV